MTVVVLFEGTQCASPPPPPPQPPPPPPRPSCPADMAEVPAASDPFCVDRYEASLVTGSADGPTWPGNRPVDGSEREVMAVSRSGLQPQGYISGAQAAVACAHSGKRLCTPREWVTACRGPQDTRYPYGNHRRADVCNDRFDRQTEHPVPRLFKEAMPRGTRAAKMWTPEFMNDPRLHEMPNTVKATGASAGCTNGYGVFDMVGNLHEWVSDPKGTFQGGFFMDTMLNGEGCEYRTTAHGFDYHDYSTGFRCCADLGSTTKH
ncbi:MAG: SUMF1/EgtB/PvdO family nonheme iron enzyme [Polyangiaceae bacterium]